MIPQFESVANLPGCRNGMFVPELQERKTTLLKDSYVKQRRSEYHAYLYRLKDVPWSIFGTLTWKDSDKRRDTDRSRSLRSEDFKLLLQLTRTRFGLRPNNLACYHCTEWGAAMQCHYHFLIAKAGVERIASTELAAEMERLWRKRINLTGLGTAEVRPFDEARQMPGVSYCFKREYDGRGLERERYDNLSPALLKQFTRGTALQTL